MIHRSSENLPVISCIMPTYGRPDYVNEAVQMFLDQDYPPDRKELVILNDCPGQTYTCDLPQNSGVRVINHPERYRTLGEKRNACIELAHGELIAVWDDDDVYLPWRLSYSVQQLHKLGTPFFRGRDFWSYWGEPELQHYQCGSVWAGHPTTLFTKALWQEVDGYPQVDAGEDTQFFDKASRALGRSTITYPVPTADRFFIMRGKSKYAHLTLGGGGSLDTRQGEIAIQTEPITDPVLQASYRRLVSQRFDGAQQDDNRGCRHNVDNISISPTRQESQKDPHECDPRGPLEESEIRKQICLSCVHHAGHQDAMVDCRLAREPVSVDVGRCRLRKWPKSDRPRLMSSFSSTKDNPDLLRPGRLILGVLSSTGEAYQERRQRCQATWLPVLESLGVEALFLIGTGQVSHSPRVLSPDEHGRIGNELHLPCPDDYPSLPQKTRLFCKWALENRSFDYLFKCDDDTYLVPERLMSIQTHGADYIGGEWSAGVGYGSGGAGYLLSRRAASIVADRMRESQGSEDELVGKHLRDTGLGFCVDERFIAYGDNHKRPKPDNEIITTHACIEPWQTHQPTWSNGGFTPKVINPAFLVIATGQYHRFLDPLLESVRSYLFPGRGITFYVCSDIPYVGSSELGGEHITWVPTEHAPWPGPSLYKARTLLQAREQLLKHDYLFLSDADMQFVGRVGDEVVGDLFAVRHPGHAEGPRASLPFSTDPASTACVQPHEGDTYYAAGIQGGKPEPYVAALEAMASRIHTDCAKGVTAVWHDESHWNRYLIDHPPEVVLDPRYCCPESWETADRRIIALDKDHAAMRRWCHPGVANCTPQDYINHQRPACCTLMMKEVLFRVADLLEEAGVTWWVDYGTLLGAYRENGAFIPHDSDCDVSVLLEQRDRVEQLKDTFLAEGFDWSDDGVVRVFRSSINRHHTDIFFWERCGDMLELRGYPSSDPGEARTPIHWVQPMGEVRVMGRAMPCPSPVSEVLAHRYGNDYMTPKVY